MQCDKTLPCAPEKLRHLQFLFKLWIFNIYLKKEKKKGKGEGEEGGKKEKENFAYMRKCIMGVVG